MTDTTQDPSPLPRRRSRHEHQAELRTLLDEPGDVLSIYLDVSEGSRRNLARARLRTHLAEQSRLTAHQYATARRISLPSGTDDALLVGFVTPDGRALVTSYPDPPDEDVVRLDSLPYLAPCLEAEQTLVHHVVAALGRDRLVLITFPRHGEPVRQDIETVNEQDQLTRIRAAADLTATGMVLLCGTSERVDRMQPRLRELLQVHTALVGVHLDDLEGEDLADRLVREVANRSAERTVEFLKLFRYQRANDAAVDGVVDTLRALRTGRAAMLLIHDDPDDRRQAWFGDSINRIALDIDDAVPIGDDETLRRGRLADVLIRAAIGLDCPVWVVPKVPEQTLADGVGVFLIDRTSSEDWIALAER